MTKFYEKKPLAFSLIWVGVYVVALSLADSASAALGTEKLVTVPVAWALCGLLLGWGTKNGFGKAMGLCKGDFSGKAYLWFLPMLVLLSTNFWGGVQLRLSVVETALYMLSMVAVGILEELIFRGLLLRVLCKDSLKWGVIVSSLTFGIGHIVNLLNGAPVADTLLQILYATAIGFLFTVIFLRSGSLVPCIVVHCLVNSFSAIGGPRSAGVDLAAALVLTAVGFGYGLWIWKTTKENRMIL